MEPVLPDPASLIGAIALTDTGERLGLIVDARPNLPAAPPEWIWVRTGIVAGDVSVVSLSNASFGHGSLVVPFTADQVEQAPRHPAGVDFAPVKEQTLRDYSARASLDLANGTVGAAPSAKSSNTADDKTAGARHRVAPSDVQAEAVVPESVGTDALLPGGAALEGAMPGNAGLGEAVLMESQPAGESVSPTAATNYPRSELGRYDVVNAGRRVLTAHHAKKLVVKASGWWRGRAR